MIHVVIQTDEEKLAMYMKMSKKELAERLIEANKAINEASNMTQKIFTII